eukprot:g6623.t1
MDASQHFPNLLASPNVAPGATQLASAAHGRRWEHLCASACSDAPPFWKDKRVVIVPPTAKPPVQGPGLARSTTGTLRDVRRGGLQPTSQRATINFPLNEWKGQAPAMPKLFPGTMRMKAPQAGS